MCATSRTCAQSATAYEVRLPVELQDVAAPHAPAVHDGDVAVNVGMLAVRDSCRTM